MGTAASAKLDAWAVAHAAAKAVGSFDAANPGRFSLVTGALRQVAATDPEAVLAWDRHRLLVLWEVLAALFPWMRCKSFGLRPHPLRRSSDARPADR